MKKGISLKKLELLSKNSNHYIVLEGGSVVHDGKLYKSTCELVADRFTSYSTLSSIEKLSCIEIS